MPKNQVNDLITDQEITFARLILTGTMNDRAAAQAAGLNPDTAAYTKAKPRVRAYMFEHRATVQQQLVDADTQALHRKNLWRKQVLDRLWEIANLAAETTRGSITGQVKAISMIVAIEGMIPDRRAGSSDKNSAPPSSLQDIDGAAQLRHQQEETIDPQPDPVLLQEEDEEPGIAEPEPAPGSAEDAPPATSMPPSPTFEHTNSPLANGSSDTASWAPSARDTRVPFSIKKNPFARRG